MTTRQLRPNPPKRFVTLDNSIYDNAIEEKCDFVRPSLKGKFYNKYRKLPINFKIKMYLVLVFIYETKEYFYKVGYTDIPLINKLEHLNRKYKSGYDIKLLHSYTIKHRNAEKRFHRKNRGLLYGYETLMGKKDREIYKNAEIVEKFTQYGNR
jgi:hypothetical protein